MNDRPIILSLNPQEFRFSMTTLPHPSIKVQGTVRALSHRRPHVPHTRPVLAITAPGAALPEPPPSASLRDRCPPVQNQDPLSSCTAHAFTSALEFLHLSEGVDEPLSRLFCYWASRVLVEGKPPHDDTGSIVANVVTAVEQYGVCLERHWPYDASQYAVEPPPQAFADALQRKVVTALPVTTLRALKLSICQGYPVPVAFTVAKSVEDGPQGTGSTAWKTGSFPLPADDDPAAYASYLHKEAGKGGGKGGKGGGKGGMAGEGMDTAGATSGPARVEADHGVGEHIVLAVGYDDATGKVIVQNSWGTQFGDAGFGDLAYSFFGPTQDTNLSSPTAPCMAYDAWTLRAQSDQWNGLDPVAEIESAPGDLSVSLDESAGSGMAWSVTRQAAGLTIVGNDFTPPAGGGAGHAVGGQGLRRFHLNIKDVGTYMLAFQLTHPWIKGETPAARRVFRIVIR